MGYGNLVTLFVVVMIIVLTKLVEVGQKKQKEKNAAVSSRRRTSPSAKTKQPAEKKFASSLLNQIRIGEENDHDHIPSTALSYDKKVAQLKTLKNAGLLTNEEYAQALKKEMAKK